MARGRPRKIEGGVQRSFRLPGNVLAKLEASARAEKVEVADIVRRVLAAHAAEYDTHARRARYDELRKAVAGVREDPALAAAFERNRDNTGPLTLPPGLGRDRAAAVYEAVEAYRELIRAGEPTDAEGTLPRRMAEAAWSATRDGANVLRAMILCALNHRPMSRHEIEDAVRRAAHEFEAVVKADVEQALAFLQALGTVQPSRGRGGRAVRYEKKAV